MRATIIFTMLAMGMTQANLLRKALDSDSMDCSIYSTTSTNCASSCGACFNPGARAGVKCQSGGVGYFCSADATPGATFACMDWSFASHAMRAAEEDFKTRTGENVYLGVGTYGVEDDPQRGLGNCYRMTVEGVDRDIIAQSINTGSDVAGNQFDLQMGAGGMGMFDACTGGDNSMYAGSAKAWGCPYGGLDTEAECHALPEYPQDSGAMRAAGDSLIDLCVASFQANVRLSGADKPAGPCKYNPTLLDVARVECPEELAKMTWFQRSDDPKGYKFSDQLRLSGFPNHGSDKTPINRCETDVPGGTTSWCLTRMMDCRKPSGAFKDNVKKELMVPGRRLVQTCTADGYTRIDVQCGCSDCYC